MNRRAFLLSAVAAPIVAALPSPAPKPLRYLTEDQAWTAGMVTPGSVVYAPHRLMWLDGNREIQWAAISDAEMWA